MAATSRTLRRIHDLYRRSDRSVRSIAQRAGLPERQVGSVLHDGVDPSTRRAEALLDALEEIVAEDEAAEADESDATPAVSSI